MTEPSGTNRLVGKTALVTGAGSRGIGREIALALAREGADVLVHGHRDMDMAQQVAAEVAERGVRSAALLADLSDPAAARALVAQTIERLAPPDILVSNAGMTLRKPLMDCMDAEFEGLLAVNLRAGFALAQAAAAAMIDRKVAGRLIFVSSVNQDLVMDGQGLYGATKGGLRQLARSFALELAPHGITSNIIAPGLVETDFNRDVLRNPEFRAFATSGIPMGRGADPSEVAGAALYLADPASAYVTGTTITIDGGKSLP
ncbi:SDR family NAD(P)-dependent oxidoreductase [Oceanomicrobium pacificus]|uniref:SDR family oxidoreductase n=1 Tax=Oceanomicrobium pacificus TaxID=2692916 RepID=A0A6B0TWB1_9RHOB|nr:SDR family NAD(P)-dependent oxidoreductase [Oceanomicrobium pacificus]MXU66025.1 SDR family oxidoreductase [Oceanomicrobium pacificus]